MFTSRSLRSAARTSLRRSTLPHGLLARLAPSLIARSHLHIATLHPPSKPARRVAFSRPQSTSATKAIPPAVPDHHQPSSSPSTANIWGFFDRSTATWQYVLADPATSHAAIIDPVLDFDSASGAVKTRSADGLLAFVRENGLQVERILETHAHADHLTAARYLKYRLGGHVPICIGARIASVQRTFAPVYGLPEPVTAGPMFDVLLADDEVLSLGKLEVKVIALPGHTPDHIGYVVGDGQHGAVFVGDSIFMPDVGSARADFPGGDAYALWRTLTSLLSFPDDYLLYVGHDYPPAPDPTSTASSTPRAPCACATVREQRESNKHAKAGTTADAFVARRQERDATLAPPRLIHPSLQVNIRAGRMPEKDEEGRAWFKTPLRGQSSF